MFSPISQGLNLVPLNFFQIEADTRDPYFQQWNFTVQKVVKNVLSLEGAWVGAKVDEEGATTVPSRLIGDFVSSLPSATVSLEIPDRQRQMRLECARNESSINAMDAEERGAVILTRTRFEEAHRSEDGWHALLAGPGGTAHEVRARAMFSQLASS